LSNYRERAVLQARRGSGTDFSIANAEASELSPTIVPKAATEEYVEHSQRIADRQYDAAAQGALSRRDGRSCALPRRTLNEKWRSMVSRSN